MPGTPAPPADLARVRALHDAALQGWPATVQIATPDGWLLRATPGLDRGRSNHALTPCRALQRAELGPAIETVCAFAARHAIRPGIQVSPLGLHDALERELADRGWVRRWPTRVRARRAALSPPGTEDVRHTDHADRAWLQAWARCDPGRDVEAHAGTVLRALAGRAHFGRIGDAAVGIAVPWQGTLGLYCVAVDPVRRRHGLGRAITEGLAALHPAATVFLQVEAENRAANALYAGLGLREIYRYAHWAAPEA